MKITRVSPLSGQPNTLDLPITQEQLDVWRAGALVQAVFPHLSPDQREFMISGLVPGEFESLFAKAE